MKLTPEEIEELQKRERKMYREMPLSRWWEKPPPTQERTPPKLRVIRGGKP